MNSLRAEVLMEVQAARFQMGSRMTDMRTQSNAWLPSRRLCQRPIERKKDTTAILGR